MARVKTLKDEIEKQESQYSATTASEGLDETQSAYFVFLAYRIVVGAVKFLGSLKKAGVFASPVTQVAMEETQPQKTPRKQHNRQVCHLNIGQDIKDQLRNTDEMSSCVWRNKETTTSRHSVEESCQSYGKIYDMQYQLSKGVVSPVQYELCIGKLSLSPKEEIVGGSLMALIVYLTGYECSTTRDAFTADFFLTSELFCTAKELLSALIHRFNLARYLELPNNNRLRFRVCYVLKVWMESYWDYRTDSCVLETMESFLRHHVRSLMPGPAARLTKILRSLRTPKETKELSCPSVDGIESMQQQHPPENNSEANQPGKFIPQQRMKLDVLGTSHAHLACQITAIQKRLFCAIRFTELLRWMKGHSKEAATIKAMSRFTNGIANWVKETVLAEHDTRSRGATIGRWILVAHQFFQIRNLDGLVAIIGGLSDTSIYRLQESWATLPPLPKDLFRSLNRITDPAQNYKTLRALHQSSSKVQIPFLGAYLTELVFIHGRFKDYVHENKTDSVRVGYISWEKYARIASTMKLALDGQQPFTLPQDMELQQWIDVEVSVLLFQDQNGLQTGYYERSKTLEPCLKHSTIRTKLSAALRGSV
ncbi:hypothetical protein F66182_10105 [Fusarium sp. NRRL 66182]|nr:hypothetical protein F66182_10105 [Fusarium sp. NRRL 66182]